MKEDCVSRLKLKSDDWKSLEHLPYAIRVGAHLIIHVNVIDTTELIGAGYDLNTTVLAGRPCDRDHAAGHIGSQAPVLIPVAIVLMPLPRTADHRLLNHHLVMIVIDLFAEQASDRLCNPVTSDRGAEDVFAKLVPKREEGLVPLRVMSNKSIFIIPHQQVGDLMQKSDLLKIKKPACDEVPVLQKGPGL